MAAQDEVHKAARQMVERYGASALREADLRVLELRTQSEEEAARLWIEIRKAIQALQKKNETLS